MRLSRSLQLLAIATTLGLPACSSAPEEDESAASSSEGDSRVSDGGAFCEEPGRYVVLRGVVIDDGDAARLEWQRDVPPASYTQAEGVAYCDSLLLEGRGWRLPTVSELVSLVLHPLGLGGSDLPTCVPAIDQTAFPGTPPDDFWTSSTKPTSGEGMYTGFFDGRSHTEALSDRMSVRCVRAF